MGPRSKLVSASLALAVAGGALLIASCRHPDAQDPTSAAALGPGGVAVTCDEMKSGDFTSLVFGAPPKARGPFDPPPPPPLPPGTGDNVKHLLAQTSRLSHTAFAFEQELIDACTELGLAAGVPQGDLEAKPDAGHGAERACNAAATRVSAMFRKAKESNIVLDLRIEPTRCFVDVDATRKCLADCGAPVKAGDVRAQCTGGEIAGLCSARCSGSCAQPAGSGQGVCHAACSGKCDRDFRGSCGGKCNGTCDGAPTRGAKPCAGVCDGSCSDKGEGVCAGRCDGSCSGAWEPPATGKCAGVCVGACSAEVKDPMCTGEYAPAGLDPVCQAACGAAAALAVRCDAPQVRVSVRGGKPTAELEKLLAGLQSAVPKIVRAQQGAARRLPRAIESAITAAVDWSNAFANAGPRPLLCIRASIDALKEAATWIDLSARGTEAVAPAIKTDPPPQQRGGEDE